MELKTRNIIKKHKRRIRVNEKVLSHNLQELTHRLNYRVTLQRKLEYFNESEDLMKENWGKFKDTSLEAAKECCGVKKVPNVMFFDCP